MGTSRQDLLDVYKLYITRILEYCGVVWHSTLTVNQSKDIENVQKLCLKIILGEDYSGYQQALHLYSESEQRHRKCSEIVPENHLWRRL